MSYEKEVFEGKTLSGVFEEIYKNSKDKDFKINSLIGELTGMIESPGDATLIVPLIKDYLDVSVKNNEHLIKLASIVQRLETSGNKDGNEEFDWEDLLEAVEESNEPLDNPELKDTKDTSSTDSPNED